MAVAPSVLVSSPADWNATSPSTSMIALSNLSGSVGHPDQVTLASSLASGVLTAGFATYLQNTNGLAWISVEGNP